jgi:hypothetical protein
MERVHASSTETPFTCDYPGCGKSFRHKSDIKQHKTMHGEKTWICQVCGNGLRTKQLLQRHLQVEALFVVVVVVVVVFF